MTSLLAQRNLWLQSYVFTMQRQGLYLEVPKKLFGANGTM
jgi:hypothetical protein